MLGSQALRERRVGGRQPAVALAALGAWGRLTAPVLGGNPQGHHRLLGPTGGCQHDARGLQCLPASPAAPAVGLVAFEAGAGGEL